MALAMDGERYSHSALKVFIDKAWLDTGERLLPLARYLFGQKEQALPTFRDQFVHNMEFYGIELVDRPEDGDFIYLPVDYSPEVAKRFFNLIDRLESISAHLGKTVVAEGHSKDVTGPTALGFPFTKGVYLNSALIRSVAPENFHALPYFIPDCLERYYGGELSLLEKAAVPTVGFCGVAAPLRTPLSSTKVFDTLRLALTLLDDLGVDSEAVARRFGTNMKHAHRTKALLSLSRSSCVKTDFVLRSEGGLVNKNYTNSDDMHPYNTEFYENLRRNLYSLCSRGTENYSVRFYETFCMGRIPVLINTDVALPFEGLIDYEKHCVMVDKRQTRHISKRILSYHEERSPDSLICIQRENREIWEDYFCHRSFYSRLLEMGL